MYDFFYYRKGFISIYQNVEASNIIRKQIILQALTRFPWLNFDGKHHIYFMDNKCI